MTHPVKHVWISCAFDRDGNPRPDAGLWANVDQEQADRRVLALNANSAFLAEQGFHASVLGSFVPRVPRRRRTLSKGSREDR